MINIKETFIKLTSKRYPYGYEDEVIELLPEYKFEKDEFDNYYIIIKKKDGTFSDTMFTSHLDTIDRGSYTVTTYTSDGKSTTKSKGNKLIKHTFNGDFIETDGNSNLGADDKAGTVIMLNMISENVPGLYYFFIGEESGCIGSSTLSREYETLVENKTLPKVTKCVSFDRKGYDSVITEQAGGVSASDEFANELAKRLNEYGFWYKSDDGGVYTDSAEFTDVIQECTNLSVGYFGEHTTSEKQDIDFLELLAMVVTKIDWDTLPIKREVDKIYTGKKSKVGNRFNIYAGYPDYYDEDYYGYGYNNGMIGPHNTNNSSISQGVGNSSTKKVEVDYDLGEFDKWYNKQKVASLVVNGEEED